MPHVLQIPKLLSSNINTAVAVAQGGEACHRWVNIKLGGEWARIRGGMRKDNNMVLTVTSDSNQTVT